MKKRRDRAKRTYRLCLNDSHAASFCAHAGERTEAVVCEDVYALDDPTSISKRLYLSLFSSLTLLRQKKNFEGKEHLSSPPLFLSSTHLTPPPLQSTACVHVRQGGKGQGGKERGWGTNPMVRLQVINLLPPDQHPQVLAQEFDHIERIAEARPIFRESVVSHPRCMLASVFPLCIPLSNFLGPVFLAFPSSRAYICIYITLIYTYIQIYMYDITGPKIKKKEGEGHV